VAVAGLGRPLKISCISFFFVFVPSSYDECWVYPAIKLDFWILYHQGNRNIKVTNKNPVQW
jgi:hypothetical protein